MHLSCGSRLESESGLFLQIVPSPCVCEHVCMNTCLFVLFFVFVFLFYVGTHLARGYSSGDPQNHYNTHTHIRLHTTQSQTITNNQVLFYTHTVWSVAVLFFQVIHSLLVHLLCICTCVCVYMCVFVVCVFVVCVCVCICV